MLDRRRKWAVASWVAVLLLVTTTQVAETQGAELVEANRLFRTGKYAECIDEAAKGVTENSYTEAFRHLKLRAEMQLGRYADALATLDAALERFPSSIQLRWLGRDVCRFNDLPERFTALNDEIDKLVQQTPWRYTDSASQVTLARWMLSQGVDPKEVLTRMLSDVRRRNPTYLETHLAIGELALEKHDYKMAGDAYQQAAKLDDESSDAWFGIARSFAPSDDEKATAALSKVLEINPHHVDALLLQIDSLVDMEKYDEAEKLLTQVTAVNPHAPAAWAYRAIIAHLTNQPEKEKKQRTAALRHWKKNPAVDHLIGKKLSQKYRFAEGETYQRQALEFDETFLPAKSQLAQDLLRLGREEEGLKLAEEVYQADGYNVFAYNLVTLQERLAQFRTLEEDGLLVRMDAREADIYGSRVLDLLKRAKATLCAKYEVELPQPIIVELFPQQHDFAIRTFGLPGGQGFLGVCFGTVITANSPASQGNSPACWEATLWHEFCHVVTLNKTNNKMPRWISEGISVYEETQENPAWGQALSPRYREMILGDDLTPVSQLSSAFLRPKSAEHLQFAYFESSLVVKYIVDKYGLDVLKRVLVDLGVGMPINESLGRYAGSSELLDHEFAEYAREQAKNLAPGADFSQPELPQRATVEQLEEYLQEHPHNYAALNRLALQLLNEQEWAKAKVPLTTMRKLYPDDSSAAGGNALLARVHRELEETEAELEILHLLAKLSPDDVETFDRLTTLTAQAEDWEQTCAYAQQWLAVNPLIPEPHRRAAAAAEKLDDHDLAAESYRALLALEPFDPAEAHFQLASALHRLQKYDEAKRQALLALEETPRYDAAQKLLLELVDRESDKSTPAKTDEPAPEPTKKAGK